MLQKPLMIVMVVITAVGATYLLLTGLQTAVAASPTDAVVFYDGALGGTPDTQNMVYGAIDLEFPFTVEATQTYSAAMQATILDTTPDMSDMAGYGVTPTMVPTLTRQNGFQLHFTLRMAEEMHTSQHRAGFNVTVISADLLGIELAFWANEVWAQEGGDPPDLFTHAEGAAFDTTAGFTAYELEIIEDVYRLSADGVPILTGPLRDYTAWEPPLPQFPDPYEQPNLIALSDNTSSAQGTAWLRYVGVTPDTAPLVDVMPASLTISETAGTAVLDVQLSFTSTFTTTVAFMTVDGTAVGGVDYTAISGTLTFTPGVTSQSVAVPILDNSLDEPDRSFTLSLIDAHFAQLGQSSTLITIADDDPTGADLPERIFLPVVFKP